MTNRTIETTVAASGIGLGDGVLGTADIVFMVMAAAAPMAVVVALMPLAFAFGNGGGVPGSYAGAVLAMVLFAVGYVRIIPFVKNAGAFYAYIAAGLGRPSGLAAAYIAALSYFSLSASTLGALAFFAEQLFERVTGLHTHWGVWAFASIILIGVMSYHRITLAARFLGIALTAEVVIILLLDVAVLRDAGPHGFELRDFGPSMLFAPGLGIAAIYAFNGMLGVEGTAIYQEEARDAQVTVPRATYIAVALVGLFYVFTAWCLTSSAGADNVSSLARANPGEFVANRALAHLGPRGAQAVGVLVLTSSFAAVLGLFNNATRYLYALARDGVLPRHLASTHPRHHSPHIAAITLAVVLFAVFVVAVVAGLDPLVNVTTALVGVGSVGLMALLAITAFAIPVFFARRRMYGLSHTLAPAAGGVVIGTATYLAFSNYSAVTGVSSPIINHLQYALLVVAGIGFVQARWLYKHRPRVFNHIGSSHVEKV